MGAAFMMMTAWNRSGSWTIIVLIASSRLLQMVSTPTCFPFQGYSEEARLTDRDDIQTETCE